MTTPALTSAKFTCPDCRICGGPAMTNSPFCGCCWMQRERKWDESRGEYREDETIPFSDPVNDSDYAGLEMYREIDSPIQKAVAK